jgi:2-(1,2-epoxy-1,2-dihydrophenyl)acetyl-CoA isomerase
VVPPGELAEVVSGLAARLAAGPTVALGAIRQSLTFAADHTLTESVEFESAQMTRTGQTADHAAAVDAFLAKEKPVFEGR